MKHENEEEQREEDIRRILYRIEVLRFKKKKEKRYKEEKSLKSGTSIYPYHSIFSCVLHMRKKKKKKKKGRALLHKYLTS